MSMSVDAGVSVERVKELEQEVEKLTNEIERLKKCKKYGLVWEEHEEELDKKNVIPLLVKDESLSLHEIPDKPMNYLIEGDNYHALKALQHTHRGRIDVIYIDPPYNTGNEFVYNDKYVDKEDSFRHSKWLSFMNKRLKLARELMSDEGVIFISIDDNEQAQLKLLCDEIFGERNFVAQIIRQSAKGGTRSKSLVATNHDYVLVYAKDKNQCSLNGRIIDGFVLELEDDKGKFTRGRELNKWGAGSARADSPTMWFPIPGPNGEDVYPIRNDGSEGRWRWGKKKLLQAVSDGEVLFEKRENGTYIVYEKVRNSNDREIAHGSLLYDKKYLNSYGTSELKDIFFGKSPFSFPKPTTLIKHLIGMVGVDDPIILDFFAGSGTTGHAVMELNKEDGGNRSFILCTNNEVSEERVRTYLFEQGLIPKNNKTEFNKYKKNNPEEYQNFLKSPEYESLGIARAVTRERLKRVIEGYTTPKGKKVEALPNNLTYLKTQEFDISREK